MSKKLIEIASEIVQNQVSLTPMSVDEITSSLRQVFSSLQELQKLETAETELERDQPATGISQEPASDAEPLSLTPHDSIQDDRVICLECGAAMRQLTVKHLVSHGMSQKEYRKKFGFSMRTPLAAKSLTKARSKAAKKRGLPENLKKAIEARRKEKTKVADENENAGKPKRTRIRKKNAAV